MASPFNIIIEQTHTIEQCTYFVYCMMVSMVEEHKIRNIWDVCLNLKLYSGIFCVERPLIISWKWRFFRRLHLMMMKLKDHLSRALFTWKSVLEKRLSNPTVCFTHMVYEAVKHTQSWITCKCIMGINLFFENNVYLGD